MGNIAGFSFIMAFLLFLFKNTKNKKEEQKSELTLIENRRKQLHNIYLRQQEICDAIKNYSICISINYKTKGNFTKEDKNNVNKIIFSEINNLLTKKFNQIEAKNSVDSLIIFSNNFLIYDKIYEYIMGLLSKIKPEIEKKHNVSMIVSITTDAYSTQPDIKKVEKDHFNIKHCDFMGTFCTTNTFSRKYKFLKQNKYLGTPLGEYSILDKEKENNYNLNLVCKNLSSELESMGQ